MLLRPLLLCLSLLSLALTPEAFAQSRQRIDAPLPGAHPGSVPAWLTLPKSAAPVAAVVLFHGSGGLDGRSTPYLKALEAAGIATLEVEMFKPGLRPKTIAETVPHALAALEALSANPAIDPTRIGAMGFSWGGQLTLRMADEKSYGATKRRYAANLGLYPTCWALVDGPPARDGILAAPTGRPMLILAGTQDDYDAPDDCRKVVDRVNALKPGTAAVHMYRATHQWDSARGGIKFWDNGGSRGRGANITVWPQNDVTADAASRTAAFFTAALAAH
jgi:dienelactone hydrolase